MTWLLILIIGAVVVQTTIKVITAVLVHTGCQATQERSEGWRVEGKVVHPRPYGLDLRRYEANS